MRRSKEPVLWSVRALAVSSALIAPISVAQAGNDWTGFYVGVGGGLAMANHGLEFSNGPLVPPPPAFAIGLDGLGGDGELFTLGVGADYQVSSRIVVGAFFDYDWMNVDTTLGGSISGLGAASASFGVDDMWSIGGRIGYLPTDRTLLFISAGYSQANISDMKFSVTGLGSGVLASVGNASGYFIGGGAEIRLTDALSLKGEYRYNNFGSEDVTLLPGTALAPLINGLVDTDLDAAVQTAKISLNYRFGAGHGSATVDDASEPETFTSWTGFYLGAGGGYGMANHELEFGNGPLVPPPPAFSIGLDGLGGDGGILTLGLGADYQVKRDVVVGAFFDYDRTNIDTELRAALDGLGGANLSFGVDRIWSLGGRIGYLPTPGTLLFVSAGYARAEISDMTFNVSGLGSGVLGSMDDASGFFLGGGAEVRLTNALSLKAEYRYNDFGSENVTLLPDIAPEINGFVSTSMDPVVQTAKVTLNYRFNWDRPATEPLK